MAKQLSDGGTDGTVMGQNATDLIGFYGVTAVAQATVTAIATAGTLGNVISTLQALQQAIDDLGLVLNA